MDFSGITNQDFDVFLIDGLEARMQAIKENIQPKLSILGNHYVTELTALTGDEMFFHVAKHARRTKNPPDDTWVAFANNPRGYKMLPHFQIGLWQTHLFIWLAIINESLNKQEFGKKLEANIDKIITTVPDVFVWSCDHTKPAATKHSDLSKAQLQGYLQKLQTIKKAELLCGVHIDRKTAVNMSPEKMLTQIDEVFKTLACLYHLL